MNNQELIIVVLAAFAGALGSGLAGWWDSHEPFDARKFMGSVWRAIFAAMSFAFTNQFVEIRGAVWIWAFLGGAGVDVIGNRLQGGYSGQNETTKKLDALESKIVALSDKRTGDVPALSAPGGPST